MAPADLLKRSKKSRGVYSTPDSDRMVLVSHDEIWRINTPSLPKKNAKGQKPTWRKLIRHLGSSSR